MRFLKGVKFFKLLRTTSLIAVNVAFLLFLAFPSQDTNIEVDETLASFIVQADSLQEAQDAVNNVGGEVTHELGIIKAVAAKLNEQQHEALQLRKLTIYKDNAVKTGMTETATINVWV